MIYVTMTDKAATNEDKVAKVAVECDTQEQVQNVVAAARKNVDMVLIRVEDENELAQYPAAFGKAYSITTVKFEQFVQSVK